MSVFTYITDLPPQVRGILDVKLQQAWLDSFNRQMQVSGNEAEAYQVAWFTVFQHAFPGEIASPQALPQMQPLSPETPATVVASEGHLGFLVDMANVQLDEATGGSWVHAMTVGKYQHPVYGEINFTPERIKNFANNVKAKIRGTDLDIDYDHKERSGEAAGWVKNAEARSDGLWLFIEWTKGAAQKLRDKAYRYFSPDYGDSWTDTKTGIKYKDVLFGGALTNRPFLKDLLPVNLSEVFTSREGGNLVNRALLEAMARRLGVQFSESTSDEELEQAVTTAVEEETEGTEEEEETEEEETEEEEEEEQELSEDGQTITLSDGSVVSADTLIKRLSTLEAANKLSDVRIRLSEAQEGAKFALPKKTLDKIKKVAVAAPKQLSDDILDIATDLMKTGLVELGEKGGTDDRASRRGGKSATEQFTAAVDKKLSENKDMSYADACEEVSAENEELFEAYLAEQTEGVQL